MRLKRIPTYSFNCCFKMPFRLRKLTSIAVVIFVAALAAAAQSADNRTSIVKPPSDEDQPKNVREMFSKMRVEQRKKEHDEMLKRGEKALELSKQLEKAFSQNNHLSPQDMEKLEGLEKIVKKIRSDLGGDDDDGSNDDQPEAAKTDRPADLVDGFKILKSSTVKLVNELKKTSRFSISAVAIQSSNSILKIVRFLRFSN